jgi:hypothetical protein
MTSLLLRVALAAALTTATVVGLVAISGSIIFADIKAPEPASLVQDRVSNGAKPLTFTGPTP